MKCSFCGREVKTRQLDDTNEVVLVVGLPLLVAFQIPGLEGYTTAYAERVHRCSKRKSQ